MNRLVIIGNGFDLAHGLPTGYCDFIDWYWKRVSSIFNQQEKFKKSYEDELVSITLNFQSMTYGDVLGELEKVTSYKSLKAFLQDYSHSGGYQNFKYRIDFKSQLFSTICDKHYIENWVDIENEYFRLLKGCLSEQKNSDNGDNKEENNIKAKILNDEFEQIKILLERYLSLEVENKFDYTNEDYLFNILSRKKYLEKEVTAFRKEFKEMDDRVIAKKAKENISYNNAKYSFEIENVYLLNFNYTSLASCYVTKNLSKSSHIQIHGALMDENNPINFGFGDEMDKRYAEIEEIGEDEYLKNIKSFAYLNTPNYKRLLDVIDTQEFQVYIMGHSCGLSDRTLLNTIFEHENCKSIKIFYHKFNQPKSDGRTDNYRDIVQNISRHFNDKKLMRERIVNKTLCEPLPQIKLPLK